MEINRPDIVLEVEAAFARYEGGLKTADSALLDTLFWDSPHTIRYGADENLYGHREIADFNTKRKPLGDGRKLGRTVITTYGANAATVSTLFLETPPGTVGRQMQTWVRMPEGWRVVAAHVSVIPDP